MATIKKFAWQPLAAAARRKEIHEHAKRSNTSIDYKPDKLQWALPTPDPWAEVFASWTRVLASAPIENRPKLLAMMSRDARVYADSVRQQTFDDLWTIAEQLGLVRLIGTTSVQEAIAAGFLDGIRKRGGT
jgi:hypothetical protein